MDEGAQREAHRHSSRHRAEILSSELCGCFSCLRTFGPGEVVDWVDDDATGLGQTALCPRCGVDSVIGSASGVGVSGELLAEMHRYWF